jgi:transcriptional regulator with XRE-family HTH domain
VDDDAAWNRAFGARVARLRKAAKLTQQELAEKAGVEPSYIGHMEIGDRGCSMGTLRSLARGLGVTPGRLVDDDRAPVDGWEPRAKALAGVARDLRDEDLAMLVLVAKRLREG